MGPDPYTWSIKKSMDIMGKDLNIVYDTVSERIYVAKDITCNDDTLVDVTGDFYNVLFTFLPPGMIRAYGNGYPASEEYYENLLICAKNDPKGLLMAIGAIKEHMEESFTQKGIRSAEREIKDKKEVGDG